MVINLLDMDMRYVWIDDMDRASEVDWLNLMWVMVENMDVYIDKIIRI